MRMIDSHQRHILVTGGAGFLGTNLCLRLLAAGHEVTCVDNSRLPRRDTLPVLPASERLRILRHDITAPLKLPVDEVYNLACSASPVHYQADPLHTLRTCLQGSLNLLELARKSAARIFQSYRGSVNPVRPRACYDEGKRCAEAIYFDYHRQHKVRIRVGRIFNTYSDGRVIPNLVSQALRNRPLTVYGNGSHAAGASLPRIEPAIYGPAQNRDGLRSASNREVEAWPTGS